MEIYQIRTFVTVAEHGNLTKAALLLHVTQPAVSGHLKSLEEALNLKLFERSASGVTLTKAGQALLPKAKAILAVVGDFRNHAQGLQGQLAGKASVGTILDPSFIRLGQFMSAVLDRYPWLEIQLLHGISTWAIESVSNAVLDAAFCMGRVTLAHVQAVPLTEMAYRVVAPPAWKSKIENADWADIAALPWIRAPKMSPHLQMVGEMFARHKLEPFKVVEADQTKTAATWKDRRSYIVGNGHGWTSNTSLDDGKRSSAAFDEYRRVLVEKVGAARSAPTFSASARLYSSNAGLDRLPSSRVVLEVQPWPLPTM